MTRADSRIRVEVDGDTKGLTRALREGERGIAGISGAAKGLLIGGAIAGATAAVVDFGQTALAEADRAADAAGRLEQQLGEDLAAALRATSDDFAFLGQSTQDMLELEAAAVDVGTALQIADDAMAPFAESAAATAAALALTTDLEADAAIDLIGKAADGSSKAMKALGISVTDAEVEARALRDTGKGTADALTDGEIAAARYALVLEALKPRLDDVAEGSGDVEQRTAELGARWETLTGKIGEGIEGPLNDLLGWILSGIDGLGMLSDGFATFRADVGGMFAPLEHLAGLLGELVGLASGLNRALGGGGPRFDDDDLPPRRSGASGGGVTLVVQPNSQAETERDVIAALRAHNNRAGRDG